MEEDKNTILLCNQLKILWFSLFCFYQDNLKKGERWIERAEANVGDKSKRDY